MKLPYLIISILFSLQVSTHAQQDGKNTQIIEFGGETKAEKKQERYRNFTIKTSPITWVYGTQSLEVEREISNHFSLQLGLGMRFKYRREPSWEYPLEDEESFQECDSPLWGENDLCDDYFDLSYRKVSPGPLVSLSARYFIAGDGFDGAYLAPTFSFSSLNYQVQQADETQQWNNVVRLPDTWQDESERSFDVVLRGGNQYLRPRAVFEYFAGIGARINHFKRQDLGHDDNGYIRNGERSFTKTWVRLEIGVRIGLRL
ncbi:MAG: hypothetical protein GC192_20740 [Bacteroidetes bacterium]|nr:hypothetical protein [Bacteroidota bacterium]